MGLWLAHQDWDLALGVDRLRSEELQARLLANMAHDGRRGKLETGPSSLTQNRSNRATHPLPLGAYLLNVALGSTSYFSIFIV